MTRTAEAKKEPAVKSDADTSASPGDARPEGSQLSDKLAALIAPDVSLVAPATSGSRFFVTALALSVILHLGVVVYLQWDNTDEVGPGGIQLEAINVDLIPLSDLRSGAPSVAPDAGRDAIDQDKKDPMEAARRDVTERPPPEGFLKPSEGTSDLAAAEIIKPDPLLDGKEQLDKEKLDKPEEPDTASDVRGRTKQSQEASDPLVKGGASVAATPGQISQYALSIQQTLNANRPHHVGTRGRAVVKFALSDTGTVQFAEIQSSSGSKVIDDAVLAAISKITFPVPPGGMTERQRSYTAPVEFR
jgi:TonB family protein